MDHKQIFGHELEANLILKTQLESGEWAIREGVVKDSPWGEIR